MQSGRPPQVSVTAKNQDLHTGAPNAFRLRSFARFGREGALQATSRVDDRGAGERTRIADKTPGSRPKTAQGYRLRPGWEQASACLQRVARARGAPRGCYL